LLTAGFVLFAVPGLGAPYWTTFFPAAVVLGVGLAILVPAVTTVALNSVEVRHSGLDVGPRAAVERPIDESKLLAA
jgi:hypothetical protein